MESTAAKQRIQEHLSDLEAARANAIEVLRRASRKLESTEKHSSVINGMVVRHLEEIDSLLDLYSSGSKNPVDWLIRINHELQEAVKNAANPLDEMNRLAQEKKEHLACVLQTYNVPHLLQSLNEEAVRCRTN